MNRPKIFYRSQNAKDYPLSFLKFGDLTVATIVDGDLFDNWCVDVRNGIIDECIRALGGRYGARATKDLRALKNKP